jgi:hypothetical protein
MLVDLAEVYLLIFNKQTKVTTKESFKWVIERTLPGIVSGVSEFGSIRTSYVKIITKEDVILNKSRRAYII